MEKYLTFNTRLALVFSLWSLTLFRPCSLRVLRLSDLVFLRAYAQAWTEMRWGHLPRHSGDVEGGRSGGLVATRTQFQAPLFLLSSSFITIWPPNFGAFSEEADWLAVLWYFRPVSVFVWPLFSLVNHLLLFFLILTVVQYILKTYHFNYFFYFNYF